MGAGGEFGGGAAVVLGGEVAAGCGAGGEVAVTAAGDVGGDLYGADAADVAEARVHGVRPFSEVGGDGGRHGRGQAEPGADGVGVGRPAGGGAVFLGQDPDAVDEGGRQGDGGSGGRRSAGR